MRGWVLFTGKPNKTIQGNEVEFMITLKNRFKNFLKDAAIFLMILHATNCYPAS